MLVKGVPRDLAWNTDLGTINSLPQLPYNKQACKIIGPCSTRRSKCGYNQTHDQYLQRRTEEARLQIRSGYCSVAPTRSTATTLASRQEKGRNDTRDRFSNQWDTDNMTQNLPRCYNCNESNHMVNAAIKPSIDGISGLAMMVVPIVSERALNMYHVTVLRDQISALWDLVIITSFLAMCAVYCQKWPI